MKMKVKKFHYSVVLIFTIALLLTAILLSLTIGRYPITPKELFGILISKVYPIQPFWESRVESVLLNIRLPRIIMALVVGCALSAAGACYQGVFQNPMAAPDILGASSGAAFGAALGILLGFSGRMLSITAFGISLLTILLVLLISKRTRGKKIVGIILSGIMISSLFSAGTSFIKLVADPTNQLPAITYWLMGGLSGTEPSDVRFILFPMIIGMIPLLILCWRINLLTLSEDEARSLGINTTAIRVIVIIAATLITSAAVSVSGMIGWVGLVVPNLCRRVVGNDYRKLLPMSMISGALFLLIVDNISRTAFATEVPLSILTAFVGAPFFLYLITKRGDNN